MEWWTVIHEFLPAACYKPSLTAEYTEDSEWTPFDLLSKLVKEWEASALLPETVSKTTKQVVIRPGKCIFNLLSPQNYSEEMLKYILSKPQIESTASHMVHRLFNSKAKETFGVIIF